MPWVVENEDVGMQAEAGLTAEVVDEMLVQTSDEGVSGATAPLTDDGYQQVAALKSNRDMKEFAHRILSSEARYVADASEFTGAIHWYSGRKDVQDLETLKKELRRAWWTRAGEGRTAPLNEKGYQRVASMKSNAHMRAFMRRILNAANKRVADAGSFDAL